MDMRMPLARFSVVGNLHRVEPAVHAIAPQLCSAKPGKRRSQSNKLLPQGSIARQQRERHKPRRVHAVQRRNQLRDDFAAAAFTAIGTDPASTSALPKHQPIVVITPQHNRMNAAAFELSCQSPESRNPLVILDAIDLNRGFPERIDHPAEKQKPIPHHPPLVDGSVDHARPERVSACF